MEYVFSTIDTSTRSPHQNTVVLCGPTFDSTSESSSPKSPHQLNHMLFNNSMHPGNFQQTAATNNYYPGPQPAGVAVEYASHLHDCTDQRKRRSPSSSKSSDKDSISTMHLRRRAQNRASQRAFRERREKHVKGLEHQLEDLHEKHQDLLQSYTRQADEVSRLNAQIAELNAQLNALRSSRAPSIEADLSSAKFDKFDAFCLTETIFHGSSCVFDKETVEMNSDYASHSFENSL